jgi:hypothetical protein
MTDHICHIRQVIEDAAPRWTFEGGTMTLHEKLWPQYITRKMTKWSTHNIATF